VALAGCGQPKKVERNDAGVLVERFDGQTTKLPRRPIAVATGGGSVWATSMAGGVLTRVDPRSGKKIGKPVTIDDAPYQLLYAFGKLWVAAFQNDKLFQVDSKTGRVIDYAKVDNRPFGMAAGFGSLWLTSIRSETIRRVDPATGKPVGPRILLSGTPYKVATGFGSVWVTDLRDGLVDRIDPRTNKVTESIRIGGRTCNEAAQARTGDEVNDVVVDCGAPAAIVAAGRYIWVTNLRGPAVQKGQATDVQVRQGIPNGQVWRIDPQTNKVVGDPIPVPVRPLAMAASGDSLWVIGVETDTLTRIDIRTARRAKLPIAIGNAPTDVAVGYGKVWVTASKDDRLVAVSPPTN
jgi:DNA-binding beta-propeller fold protein YncE